MITFIISALKIIFLLGFLILIHEGGHFIVAKLSKVTVNEFSIGFGPKIFQSKRTQTKYTLRLIPLGGFVSMEGEVEKSDKPGSFSNASVLKRILIVAAGGVVNIIFALIVYFSFSAITGNFVGTTVDYFSEDGYRTEATGIKSGDEIIRINNKRVNFKSEIVEKLQKTKEEEVTVLVKRNNDKFEVKVKPVEKLQNYSGILLAENMGNKVMGIEEDSPAKKYGIRENDEILEVNGQSTENDPYKLLEIISKIEDENAEFLILRNKEEIKIDVKLEKVPTYILGIVFKQIPNTFGNRMKYSFYDTINFVGAVGENLKELFTGKTAMNQLTGPVGISAMVSKTQGLVQYIFLLALISLSLGITNLLPFPPLDGGKIVLLIIEGLTKKPINEKIEIGLQLTGFMLLIMLSLIVTYNDIIKIF